MKILTICPTIYPEKYAKMIESFINTSTEKEHVIIAEKRGTVTEAINKYMNQVENYDFIHITNDDVIYQTKGWDTSFVKRAKEYGPGIYYGNDMLQGKNLPTFPFISTSIIKTVGWLQLPTLNRYCGDVVWKFIGESCNCIYYLEYITIEHHWRGADIEINKRDMQAFANWLPISHKTTNKVKELLNATSQ